MLSKIGVIIEINQYELMKYIDSIPKSSYHVSGQFRASNSMHSSVDVCIRCIPMLLIDFYLLKAGRYSL